MVEFQYNREKRSYNVIAPFTLFGETEMVTVASISEDREPKITLHREVSIRLVKQIAMHWDEHVHMETMRTEREAEELNRLLEDKPKTKNKKGK